MPLFVRPQDQVVSADVDPTDHRCTLGTGCYESPVKS
jgi:hypothetical protein